MNAEALTLLTENPSLVGFGNGRMQTQPLIEAARVAAYGGGYSLAKGYSKSTGVAGQLVPRPVSKAAFTSPSVSTPSLKAVKQRVTAAVRTSELELLPRQITDLEDKLTAQRSLRAELQRRGEQADLREALALGDKIGETQCEVDQKKRTLKELTVKDGKWSADKVRANGVATIAGNEFVPIPAVTAESLPHLAKSLEELEYTRSLAEQLNNAAAFDRANTWVTFSGATAAMCRVSPLHGISLDDYVCAATTLKDHLKHDCSFLIAACQALRKEGGHLALKELWRRAGGPASASSAQKMIDLLLRAPLVAVRMSREDSLDSSWIITAKSSEVNYARLGGLMSVIEKPTTLGPKSIAKSRLEALKRLASTAADRRLVELAAVDRVSARTAQALSGRKNESVPDRQQREGQMQVAIEVFAAYRELAAQIDTPAELGALLGDHEITDADLRAEIAALTSSEEALEAEEEAMLVESFLPRDAQYHVEEVDQDLELEANFEEILAVCDDDEVDALAQRLTAALAASGHSIELGAASLGDAGKQEELLQIFGEGWGDALRLCLSEPVHPGAVDDEPLIDDLDAEQPLSIEDDALAMALSIKRELGMVAMDVDEGEEGSGVTAELTLLADLTPKQLVTKMIARNMRRRERQAAKSCEVEAARRSLAGDRGRAACLDTVLIKWPDIGDKIEEICADIAVGADAKRRDGALTINSAVKRVKGGIGFTRIRLELELRHGIVLSPRALHDLRFAHDRRMKVTQRCKGIVNLAFRRSVKRISQDNLDDHSQNAVYRVLHHLRDRCAYDSTLWFQRDDHAKVRGGSSESTRGASVTATGEGASALQHDYMNPEFSSPLYATSVLVSGCGDGGRERCLAFVKAERLAPSTPSQHYADFYMAQEQAREDPELRAIFFTHEGKVKPKVQLEVDGGADEDPTKRETRFLQTELLMGGPELDKEQRRTQVGTTTREAGGTPKNKVERLNGEMTNAAANFHAIPSDEVVGPLRDDAYVGSARAAACGGSGPRAPAAHMCQN